MEWRTLVLMLLCNLTGNFAQDLKCVLITPSVLRVDTEETFVVTVHNAPDDKCMQNGRIEIWDFPRRTKDLAIEKLTIPLKPSEVLGKVNLTIPSSKLEPESNRNTFVYVNVNLCSCKLEKVILISYQSGYVFIQTDKPIYTPGSKLFYRVFSMSPNLDPVSKPVIVEFLTPDNVVVQKDERLNSTGIIAHYYKLDEPVSIGIWTISAKYKENPKQKYTTHFEVKEYVLPSFEITLTPSKTFFHYKDNDFKVDISAYFVYGKAVSGVAFFIFGVRKEDKYTNLDDSFKRIRITDGHGEAILERSHIINKFPNERDLIGCTLNLKVSVITDTGSDLIEGELDDIHIVEFPHTIAFTKTSNYFKPGMPFDFNVLVANPDGSPAPSIPVVAKLRAGGTDATQSGTTSVEGKVKLSVNVAPAWQSLLITVSTNDPALNENEQAKTSMNATAYQSNSGNYLQISILSNQAKLGDTVDLQLAISSNAKNLKIENIFYLILNKGRILEYNTVVITGQSVFKNKLQITGNHLPSFRVVAYFIIGNEIVADSLWFKVEDDCAGTLKIEPNTRSDRQTQLPSAKVALKLTAEPETYVGLVAVDKAVFALNNKFRLSQSKVWNWIEKFDPGCTVGSGIDTPAVFYDAGLVIDTNFQGTQRITTKQRIEPYCQSPQRKQRRRRDTAMLLQFINDKALIYKDQEEKKCCMDGMRENPMGYSCEQRSNFIDLGQKCINAFLDCCRHIENKRQEDKENIPTLDRSGGLDIEFVSDEDVTSRTYFPESFLWETKFINKYTGKGLPTTIVNFNVPDSITTWEVMAVSLSKGKGICIAKPHEIVVEKSFFIDLKLPYSAVRNEQIEIRAILYNYNNIQIKENLCNQEFIEGLLPENSTSLVHLESLRQESFGSTTKDSAVAQRPEGKLTVIVKSITLDPEIEPDGRQKIHFFPEVNVGKVVPHTSIETIVTIQGTPISDMVQQAIDGTDLNHLINLPTGCGEQNMMRLTSVAIATYFLDKTNQWERIGVERRSQAIQFIMTGISRQLGYRKYQEAAFSSFPLRTASTWLTAYVVRVFALTRAFVDMEDGMCDYVKWLVLNKQKPDGQFVDDGTLFATYMMGGIDADTTERDSTLTAFVLISLLDSKHKCSSQVHNLQNSIMKASSYIKENYRSLKVPYSVAIASYVLAKANQLENLDTLMSKATDGNHWNVPNDKEGSIEATSYALLTLVLKKAIRKAEPLVKWLTEQRFYGNFYGSTQATIMMFQAVAEYQTTILPTQDMAMTVQYTMPGRTKKALPYRITNSNAIVSRSDRSPSSGNFTIVATGKGKGHLKVTTLYYEIKTEKELECKNFELNVTATLTKTKKTMTINVCTRYLRPAKPGMTILEISLMTGFSAIAKSLDALVEGVDNYISKCEINKAAYNRSTVVLYVEKISNTDNFCVIFKADKEFDVAEIQPASVKVYEYYQQENHCTKFYHVDESNKLLSRICHKDACRCAENSCFQQQQLDSETAEKRYEYACKPTVDYVYVTTLSAIEKPQEKFKTYVMIIRNIIKLGTDAVHINERRDFVSHAKCEKALNLKIGQDYLIWGHGKDMWTVNSQYFYMITKDSWVERWPNTRECQEDSETRCNELNEFADELRNQGCDT